MQKIDRLIQLNQNLDGIIRFGDKTDDAALLGGGALAGAAGLKLYQGIQKKRGVMGPQTPQLELPGMESKPSFGSAAKAYAGDLPGIVEGRAKQGWEAVKNVFGKLRAAV